MTLVLLFVTNVFSVIYSQIRSMEFMRKPLVVFLCGSDQSGSFSVVAVSSLF